MEPYKRRKTFLYDPMSNGSFAYQCGDRLWGMEGDEIPHHPMANVFHVRTALLCRDQIEKLYYNYKDGFTSNEELPGGTPRW
jgi:hypothetical protein